MGYEWDILIGIKANIPATEEMFFTEFYMDIDNISYESAFYKSAWSGNKRNTAHDVPKNLKICMPFMKEHQYVKIGRNGESLMMFTLSEFKKMLLQELIDDANETPYFKYPVLLNIINAFEKDEDDCQYRVKYFVIVGGH